MTGWIGVIVALILGVFLVAYTASLILSILGWILIIGAVIYGIKLFQADRVNRKP